jgi:hypothetical protein
MIILFLFKKIDMEEFRDIKGYEGLYQISNLGRVKSLHFKKEVVLVKAIHRTGYFKINLSKDNKRKTRLVHQLVAESFLNHVRSGLKVGCESYKF